MNKKDRKILYGITEKIVRKLVKMKDDNEMVNLNFKHIQKYLFIINKILINYRYESLIDIIYNIVTILKEINDLHDDIISNYKNIDIQPLTNGQVILTITKKIR